MFTQFSLPHKACTECRSQCRQRQEAPTPVPCDSRPTCCCEAQPPRPPPCSCSVSSSRVSTGRHLSPMVPRTGVRRPSRGLPLHRPALLGSRNRPRASGVPVPLAVWGAEDRSARLCVSVPLRPLHLTVPLRPRAEGLCLADSVVGKSRRRSMPALVVSISSQCWVIRGRRASCVLVQRSLHWPPMDTAASVS